MKLGFVAVRAEERLRGVVAAYQTLPLLVSFVFHETVAVVVAAVAAMLLMMGAVVSGTSPESVVKDKALEVAVLPATSVDATTK